MIARTLQGSSSHFLGAALNETGGPGEWAFACVSARPKPGNACWAVQPFLAVLRLWWTGNPYCAVMWLWCAVGVGLAIELEGRQGEQEPKRIWPWLKGPMFFFETCREKLCGKTPGCMPASRVSVMQLWKWLPSCY